MNQPITNKDYPIELRWVFKRAFYAFFVFLFISIMFAYDFFKGTEPDLSYIIYVVIFGLSTLMALIINLLSRANFYYSIDDEFIIIRQGILNKQEKHSPYGVIQTVFVKQDLFDRIFGISSLLIENAIQNTSVLKEKHETIGVSGNRLTIPGLTKANAEILKGVILQKLKSNPINDSHSGL